MKAQHRADSRFSPTIPQRIAALACWGLLFAVSAGATSFGKNKVQYRNFTWEYLDSPHFNIYFHSGQGELPYITRRWMENAYASLHKEFGFKHRRKVPVIVYGSPNLFQQTNVILEVLPEGVGGFTELFKNRVVVPFTGSPAEYRHVLHHELVHAFEFGILYDSYAGALLRNAGVQMPLWFAEGLAEYLSSGWNVESDMFMMDRAVFGTIPPPGPRLGGYMAYKGGQSFLHFLHTARGDSVFNRFLRTFRDVKKVDVALERTYGMEISELGKHWHRQLKRLYWPEIGKRDTPEHLAAPLTTKLKPKTHFNLRPRISPDGTKIAFFSDQRDYTNILITDRNGKVLNHISQRGYGGYFESFHPFRTGVCWSPEGDRLAFVTKKAGKDEIRIVDVESRKLTRTLRFEEFSTLVSPDWAPDGSAILFCGVRGHGSDLYLYSLETDSLHRLTSDIHYEADPRFSRDGKGIVFSSRDTSGAALRQNDTVPQPPSDLFYMDIERREASRLSRTPWNEKEPCFTSSGDSVIFVSDRNGIDNLYAAPLDSLHAAKPLTNIIGGCSSPDWARDSASMVFTLFQKSNWHVYLMDTPSEKVKSDTLEVTRWVESLHDTSAKFFTALPLPQEPDSLQDSVAIDSTYADSISADTLKTRVESDTSALSADTISRTATAEPDTQAQDEEQTDRVDSDTTADTTVKAEREWDTRQSYPYRLKFSPDLINLGMGISSVYGYAGQWLVVLSDLLGNHRITLAGDVQGRIDEYSHVFASYLNAEHRFDFEVGAFYSRDFTSTRFDIDSVFHDTNIGGLLRVRYPLSVYTRMDLFGYYSHVQREQIGGDGAASSTFDILIPSASFVFDNTLWGLTGPVNGMRANATVTAIPPLETVNASFISGDLDVRKYFHFDRRFVWANRVALGASKPLKNGKDERRYFLGGTENWLNYRLQPANYETNLRHVFYSDFVIPFRGWDYFEITGSRYAVLNSEFRFPFVREVSLAWPLPLEIRYINGAVFVDMGNAWDREDQYENFPLPKNIYGGVGFGLRVNLGMFVLRYDRAWKTDWQEYVKDPVTYFSLGADF